MYKVTTNLDHVAETYLDADQTKNDILAEFGIRELFVCDTFTWFYNKAHIRRERFDYHGKD